MLTVQIQMLAFWPVLELKYIPERRYIELGQVSRDHAGPFLSKQTGIDI